MGYDIKNLEKPEDKKKGVTGTVIFHLILLLLIIWPWFTIVYPIPEADGLMASFGEVVIAGSNENNKSEKEITKEPVEKIEPVDEIEEIETVEDTKSPEIVTDPKREETKEETTPQVNPNTTFPGTNNGDGSQSGDGNTGNPEGKDDLGNTGNGEGNEGDGTSKSFKIKSRCEDYKQADAGWQEKGKASIKVKVNAKGYVTSAKINRKLSTITSQKLIDLVEIANFKIQSMVFKYEVVRF
jgi:outer membrane biosynthesis protein TonB